MKLIKLTDTYDNQPVYVNPDAIAFAKERTEGTQLRLRDVETFTVVKETIEEIQRISFFTNTIA